MIGETSLHHQVAAIVEASSRLKDHAAAHGLADLLPDLEKIMVAAREFTALVERRGTPDDPRGKHLRHDLYGAVNNMVLYAEIVREDAAALGEAGELAAELSRVRVMALGLQGHVDRLTRKSAGEAADEAADAERVAALRLRSVGARILVVDDDADGVTWLAGRLSRLGYDVNTATRGEEALRLIQERPYDVVLLDIMMPEVAGDQVLRKLRQRVAPSAVSVIMVTARDQSADIVHALSDGANDYVTKPIDFPVLLARIETQLSLKRLAALKEEFCAIASHDLRGLLTAMLATADVLENDPRLRDATPLEVREHVQTFRGCCLQMNGVIEDFLGFDAMEHGRLVLEPRDLDLGGLLRDALETHREYARAKAIRIACDVPDPLRVPGDAARLGQVVRNLLNNALKFTPRGGAVEVHARAEAGGARVEIRDSGPGLSENDQQRLFQRNARLSCDATGGEAGSGLGLYISRRLVLLHGGDIGAENRPQGGAVFWFTLPAAAGSDGGHRSGPRDRQAS